MHGSPAWTPSSCAWERNDRFASDNSCRIAGDQLPPIFQCKDHPKLQQIHSVDRNGITITDGALRDGVGTGGGEGDMEQEKYLRKENRDEMALDMEKKAKDSAP